MSTLGKFVVLTDTCGVMSCSFGGDMYFDGWGKECMERLKRVKSLDDLFEEMKQFNRNFSKNRQWDMEGKCLGDFSSVVESGYDPVMGLLDFSSIKYSDIYGWMDYLYIKNLSGKEVKIITLENHFNDEVESGQNPFFPQIGYLPHGKSCSVAWGCYFDNENTKQQIKFRNVF